MALAAALGLAGCTDHKEGPLEKAGEDLEEALDNDKD